MIFASSTALSAYRWFPVACHKSTEARTPTEGVSCSTLSESKVPRQSSFDTVALVSDNPSQANSQSACAILREYAANRESESFKTRAAIASAVEAVKFPKGLLRAVETRSSDVPIMPSVQRLLIDPWLRKPSPKLVLSTQSSPHRASSST